MLKSKASSRIFNQTAPGFAPDAEYLKSKRSSVFHRAFQDDAAIKDFVAPVYPKPQASLNSLVKLFTTSFLTKNIDQQNHLVLAKAMFARKFKAGQNIIRYGEMGSEYFVLSKGQVRVTVYQPGTNTGDARLAEKVAFEKVLDASGGSEDEMIGFGEIALLYNDKRTASITSISDCETWVLSGNVFKQIIAFNSIRRRNISLEYLDKVELFQGLERYSKLKLIDGLKVVNMIGGEYVFHQGDTGDHFFIIEEGQIECGSEVMKPDGTTQF